MQTRPLHGSGSRLFACQASRCRARLGSRTTRNVWLGSKRRRRQITRDYPGDPTVESRILLSDHNGSPIEYTETLQLFKGLTISYNYIAGTPSPLNISMRHSDRLSQ